MGKMTISKNTLRNWLTKGKTYPDELVCVLEVYSFGKDSIVNAMRPRVKCANMITIRSATFALANKARKTAIFFYENGFAWS